MANCTWVEFCEKTNCFHYPSRCSAAAASSSRSSLSFGSVLGSCLNIHWVAASLPAMQTSFWGHTNWPGLGKRTFLHTIPYHTVPPIPSQLRTHLQLPAIPRHYVTLPIQRLEGFKFLLPLIFVCFILSVVSEFCTVFLGQTAQFHLRSFSLPWIN